MVSVISNHLEQIVAAASKFRAQIYVDAEDMANNPIIYAVFKKVFADPAKSSAAELFYKPMPRKPKLYRLGELLKFSKQRGAQLRFA